MATNCRTLTNKINLRKQCQIRFSEKLVSFNCQLVNIKLTKAANKLVNDSRRIEEEKEAVIRRDNGATKWM